LCKRKEKDLLVCGSLLQSGGLWERRKGKGGRRSESGRGLGFLGKDS